MNSRKSDTTWLDNCPSKSTKSQNENESDSDHGVLTFFFIHILFLALIFGLCFFSSLSLCFSH
jgi:hypothetical protein